METLKTPIDEQFERFHAANPEVFEVFVAMARAAKAAGETVSANGLFEAMRYDPELTTTNKKYKLPNNLRSRYARLAMAECPDLAGYFRIARLKATPDELACGVSEALAAGMCE